MTSSIYLATLQSETLSPFAKESDEEEVKTEDDGDKADHKDGDKVAKGKKKKKGDDAEEEDEEAEEEESLQIDIGWFAKQDY